jgi:hypothetical protein
MLFGYFKDIPIEFDNLNLHLREMAVEKPGKRAAAQTDNQNAKRIRRKSQTCWQDASVRHLKVPGIPLRVRGRRGVMRNSFTVSRETESQQPLIQRNRDTAVPTMNLRCRSIFLQNDLL